jgi:hypothetical protein
MIAHLTKLLNNFPGAANQTRCFAHTLSIAAKTIIKQFDVPKAKTGEDVDEAAEALAELAKGLDLEDRAENEVREVSDENDDEPLNPWEDFRDGMSEEQMRALDASVQPVRSMLVKVC